MKKIFLSLLITFVFISSFFINTVFAFDSYVTTDFDKSSFPDVYTYNTYFKSVEVLYKNGVVKGYSDGKFKPGQKINRAEFIKIVMEVEELKSEGENCFTDVKNEWFAKYICGAKKKGIIKGYPDGKFRPERNISFVEVAKIITEASNRSIDKKYNKNWYHPYVKEFEDNVSIPFSITGFNHEITRGEMASMIVDMGMGKFGYTTLTYEDLEKFDAFSVFDKKKKIFSYIFEKYYNNKLPISGIPPAIDPNSFAKPDKYSGSYIDIYRDNNNVYCYIKDSSLTKIVGSDPITFQAFIDSVFDDETNLDYASDKNSIYGPNKDNNCFVKIDTVTGGKKHFNKNIFTDDKNVYYYDLSDGSKGFKKIDGADPKTLKKNEELSSFDVNFYKDKNSFYILDEYFLFKKMPDIDSATFVKLAAAGSNDHIYKDKNSIYVSSKKSFNKQDNLDVVTFKHISGELFKDKNDVYVSGEGVLKKQKDLLDGFTFDSVGSFFKDKNGVYIWEDKSFKRQIGFDGLTFKEIDYGVYADKNGVYINDEIFYEEYSLKKQIGFDGLTFKKIDDDIYADKNGVYLIEYDAVGDFAFKKQNKLDATTFKKIDDAIFADKNSVYILETESVKNEIGDESDFYIATTQKYVFNKQNVIDATTFKAVENGKGFFFQDKINVYFYVDTFIKLDGADPTTFTIVSSEDDSAGFIKDKNYVWFPDGKLETFVKEPGADPTTAKIKYFKDEYYIYDKSSVWKEDNTEEAFKKIKDADPATYFTK